MLSWLRRRCENAEWIAFEAETLIQPEIRSVLGGVLSVKPERLFAIYSGRSR
jgi:hypothetical protein